MTAEQTTYAAVAAQLSGHLDVASRHIRTLLDDPQQAALAVTTLTRICAMLTTRWADALGEEPAKCWAHYVHAEITAPPHNSLL